MVRRLLRLLVVLLCAAALLQAMRPAVFSARTGAKDVVTGAYAPAAPIREQLEYIGAELARQVPSGDRVQIVDDNIEWRLRLTQLATMHGIPVVLAGADLEVRLEFDQAAPHGVRVTTRKPATG
ncbi:hypothetical protein [Dactylosporangium sp. NPDC051541]|uniref:hypothetical protein n=1 Tax=Dactylosporangium sp. NPDC051541 TaxID=3363977 RepID=UPI0037AAB920